MKKSSIMMLALSGTMLVGCTQSEYIGDAPQQNGKIVFSGASGKMTRATSNTGSVVQKLDNQIYFYGVKKTGETYSDVFQNYILWSDGAGVSTSNPDAQEGEIEVQENNWEYVGVDMPYGTGSDKTGTQLIKYWDYSASEYNFVAGSPVKAFTYNVKNSQIESATVTGIAGHLNPNNGGTAISTNPIYIADPVKVVKDNYNQDVVFNFTRQQSFVRVGVFETIPGYSVTSINFYKRNDSGWEASAEDTQNIILTSTNKEYFTGATNATATITYDWTTPSYKFAYEAAGLTTANNWFGGALDGVTSNSYTVATIPELYGKDDDMAALTGYFTVIPTATATTADPLLIKCDYVLTSDDKSGETIKVTGATAAIPAAYAKWAQNTSYTYLFKISDNTNGTTGGGSGPEGLYPITFDAAVVEVENGTAQGTVTTVSTPSITTYQEGFAAAMKYVANKPIYVTAQNDETGALYELDGKVKVFALDGAKTEADLILTAPTGTDLFTLNGATDNKVGAVTYEAGKYGSFTPTATGYYAIQVKYDAAYQYKVVRVE